MWIFIVYLSKHYDLHYTGLHLSDLLNLYELTFRKLSFLPLLEFTNFMYDAFKVSFETKSENIRNSNQQI